MRFFKISNHMHLRCVRANKSIYNPLYLIYSQSKLISILHLDLIIEIGPVIRYC